jgi:two-component system nitrogen regulation response regulator NtrX
MAYDILIIDDEPDICELVSGILEDEGFTARSACSSLKAMELVYHRQPNLVILDVWLGESESDGLKILEQLKREHPMVPVIMFSGHSTIEIAVQAIKDGAYDFLEKPFQVEKLLITIERALELSKLKQENAQLQERQVEHFIFSGKSPSLKQLQQALEAAGNSHNRALLYGEAHVGKSCVARAIHRSSSRCKGPWVHVAPMEDEKELDVALFGMNLPGKNMPRCVGLMEKAHNGTLFFSDITQFPLNIQQKISTVLQRQAFRRIGSDEWIPVDIRFIGSISRDIHTALQKKCLHEELYYRLSTLPIHVPSLKDRRIDIPLIVNDYLDYLSKEKGQKRIRFSEEALLLLQSQPWPGNFRQLFNLLDWVQLNHHNFDGSIASSMLPAECKSHSPFSSTWDKTSNFISLPLREARDAFERDYLLAQVNRFGGNISQTARFVGMERSALHRKLKTLGVMEGQKALGDFKENASDDTHKEEAA